MVLVCMVGIGIAIARVASAQSTLEINIQQHFTAAREAEKRGDLAIAEKEYREILKLSPDLAEVSSNLGLVYYLQRKDDEAIKVFQDALKRKPALVTANLFLGMTYTRINQYDKSIDPLRKAISLNPGEVRAYLSLALSHMELGQEREAMKVLQNAADRWPDDVDVLYNLGIVYTRLMTNTYRRISEIDPDSYRVHQLLGASYEARRETKKAIEEYTLAIQKKPDFAGLHYALGNIYWKEGDLLLAEKEFLEEIKIAPENYLVTWKLGNIYLLNKQYDRAFQYLESAIRQRPDLGQAHRDLGKALLQTNGDLARATAHLKKVTELAPEEPTSWRCLRSCGVFSRKRNRAPGRPHQRAKRKALRHFPTIRMFRSSRRGSGFERKPWTPSSSPPYSLRKGEKVRPAGRCHR
jgi:tetratricopeptide (TPR) repeat protein